MRLMKTTLTLIATACLAFVGCKKKEDVAPAAKPTTGTAEPAGKAAAPTPQAATGGKSCAELGGTADASNANLCFLKGPAPFEATFTGKFDTTMMRPDSPGAVFKVTSKFDRPVKINSAVLYSYNKAGAQVDIVAGGSKMKTAMDSIDGLIEIAPGETKEFVHSMGKENLPDMDTVQLEFLRWSSADGQMVFERTSASESARPKDGWK
jgi:hypothetical protein